jgi:hypothetical protein
MTQADCVLSTPPTDAPESSLTMPAQSLQSRVKAAGMRLQRVDNNRYTLIWRHQMVVSDLTLLEAAMFIDRALVR